MLDSHCKLETIHLCSRSQTYQNQKHVSYWMGEWEKIVCKDNWRLQDAEGRALSLVITFRSLQIALKKIGTWTSFSLETLTRNPWFSRNCRKSKEKTSHKLNDFFQEYDQKMMRSIFEQQIGRSIIKLKRNLSSSKKNYKVIFHLSLF